MRTQVSRVAIESTEYGLQVEVTIQRVPASVWVDGDPRVADVPPDIVAALRKWLGPEERA